MTADELAQVVADMAESNGFTREELALRLLGHTAKPHPVAVAFARVLGAQVGEAIPLGRDGAPKAAWWRRVEEMVRCEVPQDHFWIVPWPEETTMLVRTARNEGFAVEFERHQQRISVRDMHPGERLRLGAYQAGQSYRG